ncbi:MAG: hypothetical protein AB7G12_07725 [Thermoanaerobaculia bacterium]
MQGIDPAPDAARPITIAAVLLLIASGALLWGCGGVFGGTRPFVLPLATPAGSSLHAAVSFGELSVAPGANEMKATGTLPLGSFDDDDARIVETSIRDSLATVSWPPAPAPADDWRIHVLLRRHLVAHSSSKGGVIACVSWALASASGKIVFSEQFYASSAGAGSGKLDGKEVPENLGEVKDAVHRAMVGRIVETSLRIAAGGPGAPGVPAVVANSFDEVEPAAATLPKSLTNLMGIPTIAHRRVDWTAIAPEDPVDWKARLRQPAAGHEN